MAQKIGSFVSYVHIVANGNEQAANKMVSNDSVPKRELMDHEKQADSSSDLSVDCGTEQLNNTLCASDCSRNDIDAAEGATGSASLESPTVSEDKLSGFLLVCASGGRTLLRQSRKRWFVFDSNVCKLVYFRSPEDSAPMGDIDISMATFNVDAKKPTVFEIRYVEIVINAFILFWMLLALCRFIIRGFVIFEINYVI